MENRDLIFISYAVEDTSFTDWLALKLTSAGYNVWYDRMSLLVGQSFVKEVDEGLKRTHKFLAVLSRNSVNKENPANERTKAAAIGKAIKDDNFIITLNLDGLSAADIPWTLSQKSYANFFDGWAEGLGQLLKALDSTVLKTNVDAGRDIVCQWAMQQVQPIVRTERIWTNLIPVTSLPAGLRQYEVKNPQTLDLLKYSAWPIAIQNSQFIWSFVEPPADLAEHVDFVRETSWIDQSGPQGEKIKNCARYLLRRGIEDFCLGRGMVRSEDNKSIYFPAGLLSQDKHFYIGIYGKRTYLKFIGTSTFRVGFDKKEINKHHLAPQFKLIEREHNQFQIQIIIRLYLTNEDGTQIHPSRMTRRRKKICKNWWNDKWCARLLAVMSWLSNDQDEFEIFKTPNGSFSLQGKPLSLNCSFGINENTRDEVDEFEDYPENALDDIEASDIVLDYGSDLSEEDL